MKKNILSIVVFVLLCCGLLLTLSACVSDRDKEDNATPDNPPSVEIDADSEEHSDTEFDTDIIVTPKDPDMDIVITPKDPDVNVNVDSGSDALVDVEIETGGSVNIEADNGAE